MHYIDKDGEHLSCVKLKQDSFTCKSKKYYRIVRALEYAFRK